MSSRVRWWPIGLILGLAVGWLGYVWQVSDAIRQTRIVSTIATAFAVLLFGLLWLVFASGLARRTRLRALAVVVLLLGVMAALFRVRGVSGDFIPILAPRWERSTVTALPSMVPATPTRSVALKATPAAEGAKDPAGVASALSARVPPAPSTTSDYPQFLGPERNGVVWGIRLARDWSARPPRLVWRRPIGAGWSSFAVAGGQAVTQEQRGEEELVSSYDLASGDIRWFHADRARYATVIAGEGPRATPTLDDGHVYTMGATGLLNALDLETGRRLWSKDVLADNHAANPEWGRSGSPLVVGDLVVVNAGGSEDRSLVAYGKDTGERVWGAGSDGASYSSPLFAELAGRRQIVILNRGSVAGHDPASGALLWQHPWPPGQPSVAQPIVLPGDRVLVSAGYGIGSKVFQIARGDGGGFEARLVWESPRLKSKFANAVFHDGFVYGLDDGVLTCLDPATGERRWKSGRYGHGQVLLVGDDLLVQTEEGEIVIVEPNPNAPRERARFAALEGKTWNPPALAGRHLLVRNDREAACYELPPAE